MNTETGGGLTAEWNPHWNYALGGEPRSICACLDGPYEGARLATLPRFCERCGGLVARLADRDATLARGEAVHREVGMGLRCEAFCLGCHRRLAVPDLLRPPPRPERGAVNEQDVETLCEQMHYAYEDAAVEQGWETQERSRVLWADVPEANKATMRAMVRTVVVPRVAAARADGRESLAGEVRALADDIQRDGHSGPFVQRKYVVDRLRAALSEAR